MPEINNYTFSPVSYTITEGANVPGAIGTANFTIYPMPGYEIDAADFSVSPLPANVTSVTFTQVEENIEVEVTFDAGYTMPSNNVTISLCVTGQANPVVITIAGTVSAVVGGNLAAGSGTTETNTAYSNSGATGESELLFSRQYNTATNYYWAATNLPSANVVTGNQSDYLIDQTPTYTNNKLTGILYEVYYTYTGASVTGDHISINVPNPAAKYVEATEIHYYKLNTADLSNNYEKRIMTIYGAEGAEFSLTINDGTTTTNLATNQAIPSGQNYYEVAIEFDELAIGDPDITYTLTLTGDGISNMDQPSTIYIYQRDQVNITISSSTTVPTLTGFTDISVKGKPNLTSPYVNAYETPSGGWVVSFDYDLTISSGSMAKAKDIELSDFGTQGWVEATTYDQTYINTAHINIIDGDIDNVEIGDVFNLPTDDPYFDGTKGPFEYEVTGLTGLNQVDISPNITTTTSPITFVFVKNEGSEINLLEQSVTNIDGQTVNITATIEIVKFGASDATFTLNIDNLLNWTS
jgi:hypothetical protein